MQIEAFPSQPSALGQFVLGKSVLGFVNTGLLVDVIASYLYDEYSDDADLQAFIATYNALAQGYVNWFNDTPLAVYTSSTISGLLLDWTAQGIYGISRPVISSLKTSTNGALNTFATNTRAVNLYKQIRGGSAQVASDDIYKRTLTWILYKGDGVQASIQWLRRRVARFLFGANGSDISVDDTLQVGIFRPTLPSIGPVGTLGINTRALNTRVQRTQLAARTLQIVIPSSTIAQQFAALLDQGYLPLPFQTSYQVKLT